MIRCPGLKRVMNVLQRTLTAVISFGWNGSGVTLAVAKAAPKDFAADHELEAGQVDALGRSGELG